MSGILSHPRILVIADLLSRFSSGIQLDLRSIGELMESDGIIDQILYFHERSPWDHRSCSGIHEYVWSPSLQIPQSHVVEHKLNDYTQ